MPQVTGSTSVYLILGDPVEQVRAPESFNALFARHGIDAILVPVHVAPENLAAFVPAAFLAPNIKGMWVTIPHKMQIIDLLTHCTPAARASGAVNAIRRNPDGSLSGALFDGIGFLAGLDHAGIAYAGRRVLVLGAGGAAAAIGAALASGLQACRELAFYDPATTRAVDLATHIREGASAQVCAVGSNDPSGFDLVINASPLGLNASDGMPCDIARMPPHAAYADILMKNQPTPAVRAAWARGLTAQPGFEMMIQQTHLYLDFFGFAAAAQAVQRDYDAIRQRIYPAGLVGVSPRPADPPLHQLA